ncbi:hypothetical protein YC2023_103398 [Brassica napus]
MHYLWGIGGKYEPEDGNHGNRKKCGTGVVSGISFDISRINEVSIGKKAFKKMPNLRFLSVYKSRADGNDSG